MDQRIRGPNQDSKASLSKSLNEYAAQKDLAISIAASRISGNVSEDIKKFCVAALRFFVSTKERSYGTDVGERLGLVEVNVNVRGQGGQGGGEGECVFAETVFEVTVMKEMCNVLGILHGACAAYIVDVCSVSSLVALGMAQGFDGTGVSQSMSLLWHHPIHAGQKIRVVSTAVSGQSRIRTMRSEIWVNDRLCISSVHSTINVAVGQDKTNPCEKPSVAAKPKL